MSRIAILTPYARPVVGGISTFVSGLSKILKRRGNEVFVLAGRGFGEPREYSDLGLRRQYAQRCSRFLDGVSPQVIHCQGHWYTLWAAVKYMRSHPRTRIIFSFHTTPSLRMRGAFRRLLEHADVLTFVSLAQKREISKALGLRGNLTVLRPAIEIHMVEEKEARNWIAARGLEGFFPLLAFCGPLEYPKKVEGVIDLVKSFSEVRERYPQSRLLILGDGRLRGEVAKVAAPLHGSVLIAGFVQEPWLPMSRADLYCHISYQESFGIALLEAMSLGRCVIASRAGAISELITGENGSLVEAEPRAIAEEICRLAADRKERERLGAGAKDTVMRSFTWEARWPEISWIYGLA